MTRQVVQLAGIVLIGAALATSGCSKSKMSKSGTQSGGLDPTMTSTSPLGAGNPIEVGSRPSGFSGQFHEGMFSAIYFDYDSAMIRPSETPKLDAVALQLRGSSGSKLVVEGHCDERGTAEYNRALGERRALAARDYLINKLGIDSSRISTVSYGEDRPAATGMDESAWAKNRRCEFVLVSP